MATRHFENAHLGILPDSLLSSTLLMNGYAAPLRLTDAQQADRENSKSALLAPQGLEVNNIGRCIRWAFAIEGGVAALIFAGWALWRLWM
jgi:hypothetical protein